MEAGESKAAHMRCLCCSQAADVELGAETGTKWAPAAVKTGFSPFAPLAASSPALNHYLARGERWFGTLRAQVADPAGAAVRDLPVRSFWQLTAHATLFRHTTESWTIPNWARKVCELNDGFLFNMTVSTDGNNLITIYKPLNFCTVSDNQCLPLWTTLADVSLNLATILWFSALCWFHWMKWTLFDNILNFLLAHWKKR